MDHLFHYLITSTLKLSFMNLDMLFIRFSLERYYAWDYRFLQKFAKHYSTGEVIPKELVDNMNRARNMFSAIELQRQIFYSAVDLTLFGEQPDAPMDTIALVADLKRKYTNWNHVEGTHWYTRFSHLINYGAGYYSYLYAKCFAATIWEKVCDEDPLSLSTGSAIRSKLLQHGGAKDPSHLLRDLVDHSILRSLDGGVVPDTRSLCKAMGL
ncbi:hypothetical protein HPP92_003264 [Vanilla planifolia]|uniref:Peptidase M3A/M3B catalytic domain-containing protein n=1 Tax=Vanilla planifolia TaxID=51239 RepID=A0A835S743_VANPL|nr:hypothetical protein HPP92_003264 [Vanilla planifolia]